MPGQFAPANLRSLTRTLTRRRAFLRYAGFQVQSYESITQSDPERQLDAPGGKALSASQSFRPTRAHQVDGALPQTLSRVDQRAGKVLEQAGEAGIATVRFDRNGYLYHGRVKSLAEGAREAGLKF